MRTLHGVIRCEGGRKSAYPRDFEEKDAEVYEILDRALEEIKALHGNNSREIKFGISVYAETGK